MTNTYCCVYSVEILLMMVSQSICPKHVEFFIYFFPHQCHHMSSQTSWSHPPPRMWLKCNRLLKLGRPVGAVTLSRWEWWWNERWIWGARRGGLNLISTNYPDHGHYGRLPPSRKNVHGRAGNRTWDLMVSSQDLWPPNHEAGQFFTKINLRNSASRWLLL